MASILVGTDEGVTAVDAGGERGVELEGRRVRALARDRDTWWAIADERAVLHRDASGTWQDVAEADVDLRCLAPAAEGAHVGTADARVLRLFRDTFAPVEGFDEVEGRDTWHAVGSSTPYVRSITSTVMGTLLASVHVGGIPRSANGGSTWKPTLDVEADVHQVLAHPVDPKIAMAAAAVGLAASTDEGATWTVHTDGLHATYLRAVAFARGVVLVSASDGPRGGQSAIYRRALEGGPLERCRDGLPEWLAGNVDTGCLAADYRLGTRATVAFGDTDGTLYTSDDDGESWAVLAEGLGRITAVGVQA